MALPIQIAQLSIDQLAQDFFQQTEGDWRSERRYYTLKSGAVEEVVSFITVRFLDKNNPELIELAELHELTDKAILSCGSKITWESNYTQPGRKPTTGSTVFGVCGEILYRDRGFATTKPVTAVCSFADPKTMQLRTEYSGSVFEEEIKLIGSNYRTRQSIISRAGEEIMIGQYLEKRIGNG